MFQGVRTMPIQITFMLVSKHTIMIQGGESIARTALPHGGRLYVIYNSTTKRHVYVGTATDVQERFKPRIASIREFGFQQAAMRPIRIYVYQVLYNNRPKPPNKHGRCMGIDVERLMIRLHLKRNISLRNITKIRPF